MELTIPYGKDLSLDNSSDIIFTSDGDIALTEGAEVIAQDIGIELKTDEGDLFWAKDVGRGLFKLLKDNQANEETILTLLRGAAIDDPRIEPDSVSVSCTGNKYKISFQAYGEIAKRELLYDLKELLTEGQK